MDPDFSDYQQRTSFLISSRGGSRLPTVPTSSFTSDPAEHLRLPKAVVSSCMVLPAHGAAPLHLQVWTVLLSAVLSTRLAVLASPSGVVCSRSRTTPPHTSPWWRTPTCWLVTPWSASRWASGAWPDSRCFGLNSLAEYGSGLEWLYSQHIITQSALYQGNWTNIDSLELWL